MPGDRNRRRHARGRAAGRRPPDPRASFAEVLNLLRLHRAGVRGGRPQRYDWRREEVDIEVVRAEVLRKLEVMKRCS